MADRLNKIFFPPSYSELFAVWEQNPETVLYAGGTGLLRGQGRQVLALPPVIISLNKLEEMHRISRTERFLEIGAMVKLNRIINLGKVVPTAMRHCLKSIAGPQLRNLATIGGNICFPDMLLDSTAALNALDAQFELRTAHATRWISATRFFSMPRPNALDPQELLTRIRMPLENWDYSAYQKFDGQESENRIAVFLAKTQKNVLSEIKIIYKTSMIWRDRNGESILVGKHLPLSRRIADDFIGHWEYYLRGVENIDELSRLELVNFIEINVYNLSD